MVSGSKHVAQSASTVDSNGTTSSETFSLASGSKGLILLLSVSDRVDGSFQAELFHSPDGENFASLGSTAALSANGIASFIVPDSATFHNFKIELTASSTTSGATVETALFHAPNRL